VRTELNGSSEFEAVSGNRGKILQLPYLNLVSQATHYTVFP